MTDNEIIKALEWLESKTKEYCEQCAYKNSEVCDICIFDKIKLALDLINRLQAENEKLKKLEENNMSSAPWGNETERANYYQKELEIQRAICKRLDEENEKLKTTNASLSKEIINAKIEMYKQCIEEMREKIVNTPFEVDLTGKTNEYKNGWLDGLVSKQHNILDMLDNLLKELVGE